MFSVGDVLTASDINAWLAPIAGVKSANQIVNSGNTGTTFVNDADMRFAAAANSVYEFHAYVRFASPTGADWKSSFTVPAGAAAHFQRVGRDGGGTFSGDSEFLDSDTVTSQGRGASVLTNTQFMGVLITAGTAGNLIFQWAQNTSNAGNTTLYQYSYLTARRIG